jgi:hypothetical protein
VRLPPALKAQPTEAEFTRQVIQLAGLRGWRSAHFRPGLTKGGQWRTAVQGHGKGFPDLVLVKPGRVVVAELKVGRNAPTPEQREWLAAFAAAGVPAFVWTPGQWADIERALA